MDPKSSVPTKEDVLTEFEKISRLIHDFEIRTHIIKQTLGEQLEALSEIERDTYIKICSEKTAEGKLVFSNDKLRDSELKARLSKDDKYGEILERSRESEKDLVSHTSEKEHLKRCFRIREILLANKDALS